LARFRLRKFDRNACTIFCIKTQTDKLTVTIEYSPITVGGNNITVSVDLEVGWGFLN